MYCSRRSDIGIREIESNLTDGCIHSLLDNLELQNPSELFDDDDMHDYITFLQIRKQESTRMLQHQLLYQCRI